MTSPGALRPQYLCLVILTLLCSLPFLNSARSEDRSLETEELFRVNLPLFDKLHIRAAYFYEGRVLSGFGNAKGFIERLGSSGAINTIVMDIKEISSGILGNMQREQPILEDWNDELEQLVKKHMKSRINLQAMIAEFKKHGYRVVARLTVFKDPQLAKANPPWAIRSINGGLFSKGEWVNPWNKNVWHYNTELALRALDMGADDIQFDYVRLPEDGKSSDMLLDGKDDDNYWDIMPRFLEYAQKHISHHFPLAHVGIAVFGVVANGVNRKDRLGQDLASMAPYVDVIWPMQYPSHWVSSAAPNNHPETRPQSIYNRTTSRLRSQLDTEDQQRMIIVPWVQAFYLKSYAGVTLKEPQAGTLGSYVIRQIDGIIKGGGNGFALWGYGSQLQGIDAIVESYQE